MSTLTQFLGVSKFPYIQMINNNPNSIDQNEQRPYFAANSTGASVTHVGGAPVLTLNPPRASNVSSSSQTSYFYPGLADTIEGNMRWAFDGTSCVLFLCGQTTTLLKYIRGLAFDFLNTTQGVFITDSPQTANALTDLDIEVQFNTTGKFAQCSTFSTASCPNLANVTLRCSQIRAINCEFILRGCALTAQSVENILVAFDRSNYRSSLMSNFSIDLSGGTSSGASALTAAASAARSSLLSKGIGSITLNP